jgi:hypothetical protein
MSYQGLDSCSIKVKDSVVEIDDMLMSAGVAIESNI